MGFRRPLTYLTTALLALASSSAMALGLGDIRVLSRPGQPLLAEIAVISADPTELQNLRVGLASPVTFERVGLQRPTGLISELQFELSRNAQGRAVVRVTSQAPVDTPSLAFLIEADWGKGRLVREYSALVDAPESALAVSEPEIVAPAGALSDAIIRQAAELSGDPASPATAAPATVPDGRPAERPVAAPAAAQAGADGTVTVQAGQTLSHIAQALTRGSAVGRDRAMVALLRANPEAFIRGNVNLLRQGAVLRVPDAAQWQAVDEAEARAMVREHTAQWRQARTVPQPAMEAQPAATPPPAATARVAATPTAQGARLEIAPAAAADTMTAGSRTGTGDSSEGDMLGNEQLRQAREDIATRDAEIEELRQRVAELEQLQDKQQALVSLRDTDMAAAQARLAQSQSVDAANAGRESGLLWIWLGVPLLILAAIAWRLSRRRRPSPLPPVDRDDRDDSALAAAVPAGAGLDVLTERAPWQDIDPPAPASGIETPDHPAAPLQPAGAAFAAQAQAVDAPPSEVETTAEQEFDPETERQLRAPGDGPVPEPARPAIGEPTTQPEPPLPAWAPADHADPVETLPRAHGADDPVPAFARDAERQPGFRGVFDAPGDPDDALDVQAPRVATVAETAAVGDDVPRADAPEAAAVEHDAARAEGADAGRRAAQDRMELAIAYLDLGEERTARTLLDEVLASDEADLQAQARELLARLD